MASGLFSLCPPFSCSVPFFTASLSWDAELLWIASLDSPPTTSQVSLANGWCTGDEKHLNGILLLTIQWVKECKTKLSVIPMCTCGWAGGVGHETGETRQSQNLKMAPWRILISRKECPAQRCSVNICWVDWIKGVKGKYSINSSLSSLSRDAVI